MSAAGSLVLVTTSFPTGADGKEAAGSFVSDLAEAIAERRPVRVVAPGLDERRENWRGLDIFRYAAGAKPLSLLSPWRPGDAVAIARVLRSGARATRMAGAAGSTSALLALWALPSGAWARSAARRLNVPYSVWALGSDIWGLGRLPCVKQVLRGVLRGADRIYADGLKLSEETSVIAGRKTEFLPSTRRISGSRESPARAVAPFRLLFLGRWHPNKGIDLLLDALDLLNPDEWARVESVQISGGGPLDELVKRGVARLQAGGKPVRVTGYLDKEAAGRAIANSDYLLVPSRIESVPVIFSDSAKLGVPMVVMPVGDLPSLVEADGSCGLVAGEVSAPAFAAALRTALLDNPRRFDSALSLRAREFQLDHVADRLVGSANG